MQLLIVLALLLLAGGQGGAQQISSPEMVELLKYAAGDDGMDEVIKEAEQVTSVLQAIAPIAQAFVGGQTAKTQHVPPKTEQTTAGEPSTGEVAPVSGETPLFLRPIANIADDGIYNALARSVMP